MRKNPTRANEESPVWSPCKIDNKQPLTLLDAFEQTVALIEGSKLCPKFFEAAKRPLQYITEKLSVTTEQAALFAAFVNFNNDCRIAMLQIASFVDCSSIKLLRMSKDVDELLRLGLLSRRGNCYYIKPAILQDIKMDRKIEAKGIKNLSFGRFFDTLQEYIKNTHSEDYSFDIFLNDVTTLLDNNTSLPFVAKLKSFKLATNDLLTFLKGCCMSLLEDDNLITAEDLRQVLEYSSQAHSIIQELSAGTSPLVKMGLIELNCENGMGRPSCFCLTDMVRSEMLCEVKREAPTPRHNNMLDYSTIVPKQLYYNQAEECQISRLEELLQPERFNEVCDRLQAKGMRRGFACIFYGAPGTGKTETALQLARKTGRNIIQVNVSQLRDKFVGESEKRVKELFDSYRRCVNGSAVAPILLFNEADAIISKRSEDITRSVDKMENALQNIILQEMETLEGILIATTNLTQNLDPAFERRFLYKVEFERPSLEAKQAIWRSMIPSLSEEEARTLAMEYAFSGGQIENIARKQTVEQVLTGIEPGLEGLQKMCKSEYLNARTTHRRIGF